MQLTGVLEKPNTELYTHTQTKLTHQYLKVPHERVNYRYKKRNVEKGPEVEVFK